MPRPCKIGVQLPEIERFVPWPEYVDLARRAEAAGFDSIWVGDHLLYDLPDGSTRGPYEAWTTLAATAAASSRSCSDWPWMPGSVSVIASSSSASARALLLAAAQLVLDPRRRASGRKATSVPAVRQPSTAGPSAERGAQRPHDHRVLLAHAQQHQVHGQLEAEVLEEEREVEALVELDGDEDHLDREPCLLRVVTRVEVDSRPRARRVARSRNRRQLAGGGERADELREERLPEDIRGLEAEQQLGGLAPLRQRALAVREHEEAGDDLLEQPVERLLIRSAGRGRRAGVEAGAGGVEEREVHAVRERARHSSIHRSL